MTANRDLISVLGTLERWLASAPDVPMHLGSAGARAAIKALTDGWSALILRAMAVKPLSLTELDRVIGSLSYPAIERRLAAMRLVGQIEAVYANGRRTPYVVTEWLREGLVPLIAAAHWERRRLAGTTPSFARLDIEAALLLTAPLPRMPAGPPRTCRVAVPAEDVTQRRVAGVAVCVDPDGSVSSIANHQGEADAWVMGPTGALLAALVKRNMADVELGGDRRFAHSILDRFNDAMFGATTDAKAT